MSRHVVSVPADQVPDATAVAAGKRGGRPVSLSRCHPQTSTTEVRGIRRSRPRVARRY